MNIVYQRDSEWLKPERIPLCNCSVPDAPVRVAYAVFQVGCIPVDGDYSLRICDACDRVLRTAEIGGTAAHSESIYVRGVAPISV